MLLVGGSTFGKIGSVSSDIHLEQLLGRALGIEVDFFYHDLIHAEDVADYLLKELMHEVCVLNFTLGDFLFRMSNQFQKKVIRTTRNLFPVFLKDRVKYILFSIGLYTPRTNFDEFGYQVTRVCHIAKAKTKYVIFVFNLNLKPLALFQKEILEEYCEIVRKVFETEFGTNLAVLDLSDLDLKYKVSDMHHLNEEGCRWLSQELASIIEVYF